MERLKAIAIVEAIHDLRASLVDDGAIPSHADGLRMAQEAVAAGAITFADGDDGWVVAQVKEVPGAVSQGRTRAEARENVLDALRLMLSPEPGAVAEDSEAVELTLAS